jgi:lysophospholipase L1-like esterase
VPLTGIPLLVVRLTLTFVAAALSYKYVEEPIRHGAIERRWAQYRAAPAETRRKLMTRFTAGAAGVILGLVVIVVGLGNGGSAAAPSGFGDQTHVLLGPGASTTTAPANATTTTAPANVTTTTLAPGASPPAITAIGDSVMLGAANQLIGTIDPMFATPTVPHVTTVDAAESRQFTAGVDDIQQRKDSGALGQIVVVQLGTNGTVDPGEFDRMMSILADRQKVVIINAKVPRPWEQQVNDTLAAGVKKYKNAVLLDWHGYAGAHSEFFYDDGIHLRPEGADAYARFVAQSLGAGSP